MTFNLKKLILFTSLLPIQIQSMQIFRSPALRSKIIQSAAKTKTRQFSNTANNQSSSKSSHKLKYTTIAGISVIGAIDCFILYCIFHNIKNYFDEINDKVKLSPEPTLASDDNRIVQNNKFHVNQKD